LSSLNPTSREVGSGAFTLSITGTGFINGSRVKLDGAERATTFISGTQLQTQLLAGDVASPTTLNVSVVNPAPGGGLSNSLPFTVIQSNPIPTASVISPSSVAAGSTGLTLTVQGSGFVSGATVRWNGNDRATTYVSAAQLTAAIPASDLANPGSATVTIFNPAPGGGLSGGLMFTITPAVSVSISTLDPEQVIAGSGNFTLTVNGVNFNNSASLQIEGQPRLTNYVNPTRLTAQLLAADVASPGDKRIVVEIQGATSNEMRLRVITPTASVSAASFTQAFAPEAILAGFGAKLATTTQVAESVPLPTTLAGTTVRVRDSLGVTRAAPLFFVSPNQINYLLPEGTASGLALVTFTAGDGSVSGETMQVTNTAPGLFSANANGRGLPAALVYRLTTGGAQTVITLSDTGINLGASGDQVFLILFGTGWRYRPNLQSITATLGGTTLPVSFAGAQGSLVGLDQLNLGPLPLSLTGRGELDLILTVEGRVANTLKVRMQ
jgi:uncharacterized protein (TIGR03437 family)